MASRKPGGLPNTPVGIASTAVEQPSGRPISVGGMRPGTPTYLLMARGTLNISRDEAYVFQELQGVRLRREQIQKEGRGRDTVFADRR